MIALADRHPDNLRVHPNLLALPFNDGGFSLFAPVEKDIERHDELKVSQGDVHSSPHNGVVRHIGQKGGQPHTQLPESTTRTGTDTGLTFDKVNRLFTLNSKVFG